MLAVILNGRLTAKGGPYVTLIERSILADFDSTPPPVQLRVKLAT